MATSSPRSWAVVGRRPTWGVAFDSVKAYARAKDVKTWCRRYGLQDAATYAFREYGDELASVLSLAWCHRMQWYYSQWASAADRNHVFKAADHDLYVEEEIFTTVVGCLAEHDPAARRASQIRDLRPGAPRW